MKRIESLDGLRGYFLAFMLLNHIVLQGGLWLDKVNLAQLMFVEDAQGFVFLSGFLIGLLQVTRYLRRGGPAMRASLWHRAAELYLMALALVVLARIVETRLPGAAQAYANWMGTAGGADWRRNLALVGLVFQPTFMDILPMYILFLLAAPPLVRLVAEGRWPLVMTLSLLAWMAAQMGLGEALGAPLDAAFRASDGQGLRGSFNPLGWQIVFVAGLTAGGLVAKGGVDWNRLFDPRQTTLPILCLIVLAFFLPIRVVTAHGLIRYDFLGPFESMALRPSFGPVYLLNLAGAGGLLAWLLIAGPRSASRWVAAIARGLHALFAFAPLRLLGRHSLQTYAWHVAIVYALRYVDMTVGPFTAAGRLGLALLALALLPLPALWREHGAARRARSSAAG